MNPEHTAAPQVIDRQKARKRFDRAAASYSRGARLEAEIESRMLERLDYVRISPRRMLDAGCGPSGAFSKLSARYRGANAIGLDFSLPMLRQAVQARGLLARLRGIPAKSLLCGLIEKIPLAPGSVDLVWSNMALHWSSNLPGALAEFHRVLGENGLLMFSTLGPDTLKELRLATGGARVHRFVDMHDLGDMLISAGFAAPVMDMEMITLQYATVENLFADLRGTGQMSALAASRTGLGGESFMDNVRAGLAEQRCNGVLNVSCEVVYGHAWKGLPRRPKGGVSVVKFDSLRQKRDQVL